jgi:hypothetical protein
VSVVVVTTISCDALIQRCSSCQAAVVVAAPGSTSIRCFCRTCDSPLLEQKCGESFALRRDGILIRCIAENKDGWRCEDRDGRDFCPEHAHLAEASRIERATPRTIGNL